MPSRPQPISVRHALGKLRFFPDRTPTSAPEQSIDAFAQIADYRDGGIYVGHWAGDSEWERHPEGDEIVMVIDGATTMFFVDHDGEQSAPLRDGDLVVVPRGTWHRFETPQGVQILRVTPQPTDHRADRPF